MSTKITILILPNLLRHNYSCIRTEEPKGAGKSFDENFVTSFPCFIHSISTCAFSFILCIWCIISCNSLTVIFFSGIGCTPLIMVYCIDTQEFWTHYNREIHKFEISVLWKTIKWFSEVHLVTRHKMGPGFAHWTLRFRLNITYFTK